MGLKPTYSRATNRPRLAFGSEKSVFLLAGVAFLFALFQVFHHTHSTVAAIVSACVVFAGITRSAAALSRQDHKYISVKFKALFHPAIYDPGLLKRFPVQIKK